MTERSFNLVVPLAHEANDMRTTDTAGSRRDRSGAVTLPRIRTGDMESTMGTPTPGIRTSTTATRTTTTRTTTTAVPEPSADRSATPDFTFTELTHAYFDCRRKTVNSAMERVRTLESDDLFETANSYFGLLRQADASHHDRARLANTLRYRGHTIKADLTKTYRRNA